MCQAEIITNKKSTNPEKLNGKNFRNKHMEKRLQLKVFIRKLPSSRVNPTLKSI